MGAVPNGGNYETTAHSCFRVDFSICYLRHQRHLGALVFPLPLWEGVGGGSPHGTILLVVKFHPSRNTTGGTMSTSFARALRKNPTKAEHLLWYFLSRRQMNNLKFRRQEPIGRYIVDFVCYSRKLIIEIDGGQHATQHEYDQERTAWLNSQGFRVLRFWNNEVLANTEGVLTVIMKESA
jgi:very-short-patch-repair endonuclease